jgi:ABC-type histidine transport system ATPase subunit
MDRLKVQVENLCNFMPQERVQSFAQLSSKQLLVETMRTVGGAQMISQYESLIEAGQPQRQLSANCLAEEEELRLLTQRNAAIEPEVQRFLDRQSILDKIALLEAKRPWMR